MQGIKAIKTLVAVMGLLIVVGVGFLVYGLMATKNAVKPRPVAAMAPLVVADTAFGTVAVPVPAGTRMEQVMVAADKVVVRLGGGSDRLLVLDPTDGRVLGSFVLAPEAPAGR